MPEAILEPQTRLEIASGLYHRKETSRVGVPILVHEPRKVTKTGRRLVVA